MRRGCGAWVGGTTANCSISGLQGVSPIDTTGFRRIAIACEKARQTSRHGGDADIAWPPCATLHEWQFDLWGCRATLHSGCLVRQDHGQNTPASLANGERKASLDSAGIGVRWGRGIFRLHLFVPSLTVLAKMKRWGIIQSGS